MAENLSQRRCHSPPVRPPGGVPPQEPTPQVTPCHHLRARACPLRVTGGGDAGQGSAPTPCVSEHGGDCGPPLPTQGPLSPAPPSSQPFSTPAQAGEAEPLISAERPQVPCWRLAWGWRPSRMWGRGVVWGGHQVPPRGPLGSDVFSWSSPGVHCRGQKSGRTRPQPPATSPQGHSSRGSPSWGPLPSNLCPEAPAGRGRGGSSARTHKGAPKTLPLMSRL